MSGIGRLYYDGDGKAIRMTGVVQDVTDRTQSQAALRLNEERYRTLSEPVLRNTEECLRLAVESANIGTWDFNLITGDNRWDARCKELFGFPPEAEVSYAQFLSMVHPDDRDRVKEVIDQSVDPTSDGSYDVEYRIIRADGEERWIRAMGRAFFEERDGIRTAVRFVGAAIDFTERKEAEAVLGLRARQQQALAALGQAALGQRDIQTICELAVECIVRTLDVELCKVLELLPSGQEVLLRAGIGWQEGLVGHATVSTGLKSQAGYTLATNKPIIVDDLRTETRFSGPPLLHDHGVVSGMSCIIWGVEDRPWGVLGAHTTSLRRFTTDDVAFLQGVANVLAGAIQREQAEEALREAQTHLRRWNVELEQAVNLKTTELQQSQDRLRALTSELNLAEQRERKRLATELHDHLQQMLVFGKLTIGWGKRVVAGVPACETVLKKVDDILSDALTYSRTFVDDLSPPVLRDHGLAVSLKWLAEYMKDKYEHIVAVVVPDDQELTLPEDQVILLFQSVRELLINSAKHAGTGQASLTMEQREGNLLITVKDGGKGFDLAAAPAAGTSSGGISSKYGLYSVEERMRALGGSFTMDSTPEHGTTATLVLPLTRSAEEGVQSSDVSGGLETARAAYRTQEADHPMRDVAIVSVLLVDDHAMVRQGMRSVLDAYADLQVVAEARDGVEAIKLVEQYRPRVVVMDINMPRMNGIEATEHITRRYPDTIVIGISVNIGDDNSAAMQRAGAAMLVTKEAAVEQLYNALLKAMKSKRDHCVNRHVQYERVRRLHS